MYWILYEKLVPQQGLDNIIFMVKKIYQIEFGQANQTRSHDHKLKQHWNKERMEKNIGEHSNK